MAWSGIPYLLGSNGAPSAPLPAPDAGTWSIAEFQLPLIGGLAGHNGFALLNPQGTVVCEINGLATNSHADIIPVGVIGDSLRAYAFPSATFYQRAHASHVVACGSYASVVGNYWRAAMAAGSAINKLQLPYPFLGLGANSNSVASTLATTMHTVEPAQVVRRAPIMPGLGERLLSAGCIAQIQLAHNVVPTISETTAAGYVTDGSDHLPADEVRNAIGAALPRLLGLLTQVQTLNQEVHGHIDTLHQLQHTPALSAATRARAKRLLQASQSRMRSVQALAQFLDGGSQRLQGWVASTPHAHDAQAGQFLDEPRVQLALFNPGALSREVQGFATSELRHSTRQFLQDHTATPAPGSDTSAPGSDVLRSITDYRTAYYVDWAHQARLFQYGTLVNGNLHQRSYRFSDGSSVVIQAHVPATMRSAESTVCNPSSWLSATGMGLLGLAVGLRPAPEDAAWQGYTLRYYASAQAALPWATSYCYGWARSPNPHTAVTLDGQADAAQFYDFADNPDHFTWHTWRSGNAPERAAENLSSDACMPDAQALVQAMARVGGDDRAAMTTTLSGAYDTTRGLVTV